MLYVLLEFCKAFFNSQQTLQSICLWVLKISNDWQEISKQDNSSEIYLDKPVLSAAGASPELAWWFANAAGTFSQRSPRHSPESRAQSRGPVIKNSPCTLTKLLFILHKELDVIKNVLAQLLRSQRMSLFSLIARYYRGRGPRKKSEKCGL